MIKVPRASLIVTVLDDQDYIALCKQRNGFEAFGVFTSILIAGRERLGRKRASRIEGTESLRFDDLTEYVLTRIHASEKQLERCLTAFADVAKKTCSKPWVYQDKAGHLVVRSFFKFNGSDGWGGSRDGAGRKSKGNQNGRVGNQDDSNLNGLDSNLQSTWSRSDRAASAATDSNTDSERQQQSESASAAPLLTIHPGAYTHSESEVEQFRRDLWAEFKNLDICEEWHEIQRKHSLPAWRAAFAEAKRRKKSFSSVAYVEKIAHDFDDSGRKKAAAENGSRGPFDPDPDAQLKREREILEARYGGRTDG